jgi:glycine/D-amino acid oxidase-like deaminating enzyme
MLATAPAPVLAETRPVYRRWGYDYWHQLPDGRVALGGCRDLDPDAAGSAEPDAVVQSALETMLRDVVGCDAPVTHRWAAHVAYSATHMPVCDEVRPGIWAIGAYSGTGNVVGALCGRAVAQRIARGSTELWF